MEEEENSRISCLKSGENRKTKKISARGTDSQDMNSIRGLKKELLHSSVVCKFLLVEYDWHALCTVSCCKQANA